MKEEAFCRAWEIKEEISSIDGQLSGYEERKSKNHGKDRIEFRSNIFGIILDHKTLEQVADNVAANLKAKRDKLAKEFEEL